MNWAEKIMTHKELPVAYIKFYAVGLVIFMVPFTRPLFVHIIALSLLLVIFTVFYMEKNWNGKLIWVLTAIAVSSFFIEMTGVNGGEIFGEYKYGQGLGVKVNGTPLIIGINWAFLSYAAHDIASRVVRSKMVVIILGAVLMIIYDLIMEWVAPLMNMWSFETGYPPFRNFTAWFLFSLIFISLFELFRIKSDNRSARVLFIMQQIFFVIIGIYGAIFIRG
ncbi:MAG: carotenoid biosynthesis protein [Rikenellaceae bacterium]|nr:carotenoid biosynthesis protein [Rikenellaceae bacterium]